MKYKKILITGGAGFVGSTISLKLKILFPHTKIIVLDNLIRKGSELNVPRLEKKNITFIKGDIRNKSDLELPGVDLIIECSAEPSVMAGITSAPEYVLDTNLVGALNCFELARKNKADVIFLSTSRVYPIKLINSLKYKEEKTRFSLFDNQDILGASGNGISEEFSLIGVRSLYGATKLCAEYILQEYIENYGIQGVINRCGLISGPWQMGKVDQGIIVYWLASHIFKKPLSYRGYGGTGKQVRDVIHIDDIFDIVLLQIENMQKFNGGIYNIGGGKENSISLLELTQLCRDLTGNTIEISSASEERPGDVRIYITDNKNIESKSRWNPKKSVQITGEEIYEWIMKNKEMLMKVLN